MRSLLALLCSFQAISATSFCYSPGTYTQKHEVVEELILPSQEMCEERCSTTAKCTAALWLVREGWSGCALLGEVIKNSLQCTEPTKVWVKNECAPVHRVAMIRWMNPAADPTDIFSNATAKEAGAVTAGWASARMIAVTVLEPCVLFLHHSNGSVVEYPPLGRAKTLMLDGLVDAHGTCR